MERYKLLLNEVYLYVKQHPEIMIASGKYTKLEELVSVARKTLIKQYKAMESIIFTKNDLEIKNYYNELDNKYHRAYYILRDLVGESLTIGKASKLLGISEKTMYEHCKSMPEIDLDSKIIYNEFKPEYGAVYICKRNGEIIYIGSTHCFERRKMQHLNHIEQGHNSSEFYKLCKPGDKIEIIPLIEGLDKKKYLELERNLIKLLQPVGNIKK